MTGMDVPPNSPNFKVVGPGRVEVLRFDDLRRLRLRLQLQHSGRVFTTSRQFT
jgi:hypothetical protein